MALGARHRDLVRRFVARLEAAVKIDENELVRAFVAVAGRNSAFTADAYARDLAGFRASLRGRGVRLLEATAADVDTFVAELDSRRPALTTATFNRKLHVVRSVYCYFAERLPELALPNPVLRRHLRRPAKRLPRPVPDAVVEALVTGVTDVRDRALILMYLETGLRLRALLRLTVADLSYQAHGEGGTFLGTVVAVDKGGGERRVYFTIRAWEALQAYLRTREVTGASPLFTNARGDRLSPRGAQVRLAYWCRRLGLPHVHVHQLRHTLATMLLRRSMPVEQIQRILGHRQLSTTLSYAALEDEEVQAAYHDAMDGARHRPRKR